MVSTRECVWCGCSATTTFDESGHCKWCGALNIHCGHCSDVLEMVNGRATDEDGFTRCRKHPDGALQGFHSVSAGPPDS